jgi:hypothetical protein
MSKDCLGKPLHYPHTVDIPLTYGKDTPKRWTPWMRTMTKSHARCPISHPVVSMALDDECASGMGSFLVAEFASLIPPCITLNMSTVCRHRLAQPSPPLMAPRFCLEASPVTKLVVLPSPRLPMTHLHSFREAAFCSAIRLSSPTSRSSTAGLIFYEEISPSLPLSLSSPLSQSHTHTQRSHIYICHHAPSFNVLICPRPSFFW